MLYHWESTAALSAVRDEQTAAPLALTGEGLWVCLLSSGSCTAALGEGAGALPALAVCLALLPLRWRRLQRLQLED